jgi:hypothetical protein
MTDLRQVVARAIHEAAERRHKRMLGSGTANMTVWQEYADAGLAAIRECIGGDVVAACLHLIDRQFSEVQDDDEAIIRAIMPLIALAGRDATLEEAAKECERVAGEFAVYRDHHPQRDASIECAEKVRALKGGPARGLPVRRAGDEIGDGMGQPMRHRHGGPRVA